jgi:hypothetical protein
MVRIKINDKQTFMGLFSRKQCLVDLTPKLWPMFSRVANRFRASISPQLNGRITLAHGLGGVEGKRNTCDAEQC